MFLDNENKNDVENTTENVGEQTTEELVEGANVTTDDGQEPAKEKTYTEADFEKAVNDRVDELLPRKIERAKSKN